METEEIVKETEARSIEQFLFATGESEVWANGHMREVDGKMIIFGSG